MTGIVVIPALGLGLLLAGCSDPTIDASSEEAFYQSSGKILESLDYDQREDFTDALIFVTTSSDDWQTFLSGYGRQGDCIDGMLRGLDGLTAAEVIAKSEELRRLSEQRERQREQRAHDRLKEQLRDKVENLEKRKAATESAKRHLEKFAILEASLIPADPGEVMSTVKINVENATPHPVSRAFFHGKLLSPGRSVPWGEGEFHSSIPGGIEPGEKMDIEALVVDREFLGDAEPPDDAFLEIEVVQLDGADGEPLWASWNFDDRDQECLDRLRKEYDSL
ncbi:hypothetical protein LWH48_12030 [Halomonas sp. G15]|uniref:DUF6694 family lipoprotein n=1 Tax=Halomonas sp. G15 TaxID=2903521 RepID=UPI001E53848B|nr:DUF6694 family lipoprotein [Halomonas sp. G15]MCE0733506.1 hypothetical protein [Halomonas sp. G15]